MFLRPLATLLRKVLRLWFQSITDNYLTFGPMKCEIYQQFLILHSEELLTVIHVIKIVTSTIWLWAEHCPWDELARKCVQNYVKKILGRPQGGRIN